MDMGKSSVTGLMGKLNDLSLPAVVLVACIILGGSYYATQVSKQKSIEKQQQTELQEKARQEKTKTEEVKRANEEKERSIALCLTDAEVDYWEYMRLNGTTTVNGKVMPRDKLLLTSDNAVVKASDNVWSVARQNKQTAIDNCYKRFK